jgi:NOL1/NOP2/fmu family ribosome biogenesis protein
MQKLTILNSKEVKKIKEIIVRDFNGFLKGDYAFLQNEKNRIFVINKDLARIDLNKLRIDKIGLYFAEYKNKQVRLSKEGTQLLVNENKGKVDNIVDLDEKETKLYFQGQDLPKDLGTNNKPVILRHNKNILGYAKYKDKIILNFLPKIYRGEVILR